MGVVTALLVMAWLAMVVVALVVLIRGRVDALRLHSRKAGAWLLAASLPVFIAIGIAAPKKAADTVAAPAVTSSAAARPATTSPVASSSAAPTSSAAPAPATSAQPAGLTCADIGGKFVPHGTDGRGDCESADPSPKCHWVSGEDDPNSVTEFVLTPPFPTGTVSRAVVLTQLLGGGGVPPASNASCWHLPG